MTAAMTTAAFPNIWLPDRRLILPRRPNVATGWRDRLRRLRNWMAPTKLDAQGRFVQAGGRVVGATGQKAGDTADCDQCPCGSGSGGGGGDCAYCDHPPPTHILATFDGIVICDSGCICYFDFCAGSGESGAGSAIISGDINGSTFRCEQDPDNKCRYVYNGPCPLTLTGYSDATCGADGGTVCRTYTDLHIELNYSNIAGTQKIVANAWMPIVGTFNPIPSIFDNDLSDSSALFTSAQCLDNRTLPYDPAEACDYASCIPHWIATGGTMTLAPNG